MLVLCIVSAIPRQVSRRCKAEGSYCTYHDRVVNTWSIVAIATKLTMLEKGTGNYLQRSWSQKSDDAWLFGIMWQYIYIYINQLPSCNQSNGLHVTVMALNGKKWAVHKIYCSFQLHSTSFDHRLLPTCPAFIAWCTTIELGRNLEIRLVQNMYWIVFSKYY